jgi:phosphoribosylaminoimidazole-succinocarboxamide synthase
VEKRELLYEGKAKQLYATDDPNLVIQYFKDDATAFDGTKKATIAAKGVINNACSEIFFNLLESHGVKTHFVERLSEREMLCRRLEIVPVEMIVRNVMAGSLARRLGRDEGAQLASPIVEYCYKSDALHDPLINRWHVTVLGFATGAEIDTMTAMALRVNEILLPFLAARKLLLIDLKLEFGRFQGDILLGDEICPDTCRFWDADTGKKLDKDRFRHDLGDVAEAYHEVHRRLTSPA